MPGKMGTARDMTMTWIGSITMFVCVPEVPVVTVGGGNNGKQHFERV
jgi:hypothetical protein